MLICVVLNLVCGDDFGVFFFFFKPCEHVHQVSCGRYLGNVFVINFQNIVFPMLFSLLHRFEFLIAIFLFQAILYDAQTPVFHISMNHLPNLIDSILSFCISIIKFKLQSTQLKHMTHMCFCMRKNWGDFLLLMGVSFYYEKWKLHFKWQ